jgi:hypothetical protein
MAAKSRKVFVINLPFEQVMPAVEKALQRMGAKISNINRSEGDIKAKKGMSLTSWGNNITVSITRSLNGCYVDVLSECAMPTQVIDWGSNEGNIKNLAKELSDAFNIPIVSNLPGQVVKQAVVEHELLSSSLMCPQCHRVVPDETKFCPYDGTQIGRTCSKCKTNNMPSAQFCVNCGTQL